MKKVFGILFFIIIFGVIYFYKDDIYNYIFDNYIYKKEVQIPSSNEYKRNHDFEFVKETNNFFPNNRQELLNVFYTILNNGYSSFTFYCGEKYEKCADDLKEVTSNNNQMLSTINNYVHPYNSYSTIKVNMNSLGRINVSVTKLYNFSDIYLLNNFVDKIYNSLIKDNMTNNEKIKTIHDFIIDNATYDKEWIKNKNTNKIYKSNTAFGPLLQNIGLCGGYTDAMELFLEKMNIKSYKIASDNHIWNYVYIDNNWKHLDLTWDDPVTNTGKNIIQYNYYLIDTKKLELKKDNEHQYIKDFYLEAK